MQLAQIYSDYYTSLFGVAYRMLGTISDAEDIVQDVFVKLYTQNISGIKNLKAYMVKMTTNGCLNFIQSSRRSREIYPGTWLPEPLRESYQIPQYDDVNEIIEHRETIQYALLVLLQSLSAYERAVFILKETLDYSYREIADILDKTESNCRQIYSRTRKKLKSLSPHNEIMEPISIEEQEYVFTFINAIKTGELEPFIQRLHDDVKLISDGGGKVLAALKPIIGIERVKAFLQGIMSKGSFDGDMSVLHLKDEIAVLLKKEGRPKIVFLFHITENQKSIINMYLLLNPDKLQVLKSY